MKTVLWWIRRDLRLADNEALEAAMNNAESVIPVFILDPVLLYSPQAGEKQVAFLLGGLRQLDADLRARGNSLVVRRGDPAEELAALMGETGAHVIFAEADNSPYARQRDAHVAQALPLHLTSGQNIHSPDVVMKANGTPYTIFTPFSRVWKAMPLPAVKDLLVVPAQLPRVQAVPSLPIPAEPLLPPNALFPPGEAEAQCRLHNFVASDAPGIYCYAEERNRIDLAGTSKLSPYLRFGMLSARQVVMSALSAQDAAEGASTRKGVETWLNELIWREFYFSILYHFPQVSERSYRSEYRNIAWENEEAEFAAWCDGRTGYPIIDAAMHQLVETGWMHNRARMIVASFLVKDLLVDWRWGERFFMQHLVDGDLAANNGGWQWTAGTGTDAAPFFRIFNPVLQGKQHDPDGAFVRRWLPNLARVPNRYIHTPWEMPLDVQRKAGCVIGKNYPAPIVDHAWARERTLAAYARAREFQP